MEQSTVLELPIDTRLTSVFDLESDFYFKGFKPINNIVHVIVQRISTTVVELLEYPLNYFRNEFVLFKEPEIIPVEELEQEPESTTKKKSPKN